MSIEAASSPAAKVDARPVTPVSTDAVWAAAISRRDRLAAAITAALDRLGWKAFLLKSQNGNYPAWIRLEGWIPDARETNVHRRAELELIIDARPLHRHQLVVTARATRGKRSIALVETTRFSEEDAVEWALYTLGGRKPSTYHPFVDRLMRSLGAFVPPLRPRHNPIAPRFRNRVFDLRLLLAVLLCALFVAGLIQRSYLGPIALALGGAAVLGALVLPFLARRYKRRDWVTPRPNEPPSMLGHVDSWHAVLSDVAGEADKLAQRIVARLEANSASGFFCQRERVGYRTANGYEERERLVVSRGQGRVHIHMHPAGRDLFVGWQAHLNWAQWSESAPVARRDAGSHGVAYRDLKPGWYLPGDFDLIDLDSLGSVVHSAMEQEIKALLDRQAIEQEVDFEVNRGDRTNALDARKAWPERTGARARNSNVIFGASGIRRSDIGDMQLAPVNVRPAGAARGLAAIPAVIMLPVLVALGHLWLNASGAAGLYPVELPILSNLPFRFFPLFYLPLAIAIAFGIWCYAGVRFLHALMTVALAETFGFGLGYLYQLALFQIVVPGDFAQPAISLLASVGLTTVSGIGYLLAGAVWGAPLREPRRWLAAIVLWALFAAGAILSVRGLHLTGTAAVMTFLSPRVFMAACIGYWLWREEPGGSWLHPATPTAGRARASSTAAAAPAPTSHRGVESTRNGVLLGLLFVATGLIAFQFSQELGIFRGRAMAPGAMPTLLAILLVAAGAITAIEGMLRSRRAVQARLTPMFFVIGAVVVFGMTAVPAGLLAASALTSGIAAYPAFGRRPGPIAVAVILSVAITFAVVTLFNLNVPLWPRP